MNFKQGDIQDVTIIDLQKREDNRGHLIELFRQDWLPEDSMPVMGYISLTHGGIIRGPHEHNDQTDMFCFIGPATFLVMLWDNRPYSPTYKNKISMSVGKNSPTLVVVPPGVVHGYQNISEEDGLVYNFLDQLFMGPNRSLPADEIRHESDPNSPFKWEIKW